MAAEPVAPEAACYPRNFKSHALRQTWRGVWVLRPALRLRITAWLVGLPGAVILLLSLLTLLQGLWGAVVVMLFGAAFLWAGFWQNGPIFQFRLAEAELRSGYPLFRRRRSLAGLKSIQLIDGGSHRQGRSEFRTYQVNLVFGERAEQRINVLNHSDYDAALGTGRQLADLLKVPLAARRRV